MALEFILLLKDTLYAGVVPDRNKRATQNTLIQPWQKSLRSRDQPPEFIERSEWVAWVYLPVTAEDRASKLPRIPLAAWKLSIHP